VLFGGVRSGEMNAGVSFQKVDCLTRSVSTNIALLEDKELATDLTHDAVTFESEAPHGSMRH